MPQIRLIVYRCPINPSHGLRYFDSEEFKDDVLSVQRLRFRPDYLGEEIYRWASEIDVWGGITNEDVRRELQELVRSFDGSSQAREQGMTHLEKLAERLEEIAKVDELWIATPFDSTDDVSGDTSALRIAPTLAFANHLRWMCETFANTPELVVVYG